VSTRDDALLERAAAEARRAGWLTTAPNPRVGALALCGGHVVGYGHHAVLGGPHAEEVALRDADAWDAEAGTWRQGAVDEMVVTLEPCSSKAGGKRRAPCLDALLAAGVRRLVVGATDPDPRHAGAALQAFRDAGGEVVLRDHEAGFRALNRAFLHALGRPGRPWVLLKWAASLDGRTATASGVSQWISGPQSRAEVHALRACSDAVLAGAGTLVRDDPGLDARDVDLPHGGQPLRVLLLPGDGAGIAVPRALKTDGPRLWVHGLGDPLPDAIRDSGDPSLALPRHESGLDLTALLTTLREEHGVRRLFVEGGTRLHGALVSAGLVDAVARYEAPRLFGGGLGACAGEGPAAPDSALALVDEERADLGDDLRRAFQVDVG
jgi:diaminohydroxyphosphoribosylaminopyrimidine deaminase/5-amino-6-(5-phosphoribosylamino)uracil reductase